MERIAKLLEDYKEAVWQHAHSFTLDNQLKEDYARKVIMDYHADMMERARKAPRCYHYTIW